MANKRREKHILDTQNIYESGVDEERRKIAKKLFEKNRIIILKENKKLNKKQIKEILKLIEKGGKENGS